MGNNNKVLARLKRKKRIQKKVFGTSQRPRLVVFRSLKHIYAQVIDDENRITLASATSSSKDFTGSGGNVDGAKKVGRLVAEYAVKKGIQKVVFDRNGYLYHGRVQSLAQAAREAGLEF